MKNNMFMNNCLQNVTTNFTECPQNPIIDVLFVVDGSSSVGQANFDLVQAFVRGMVEMFYRVKNDGARVSVVAVNDLLRHPNE